MDIRVNGEVVSLPVGKSGLLDVFATVGIPHDQAGIAVAINMEVVPRGEWVAVEMKAGDVVEIITARQGG